MRSLHQYVECPDADCCPGEHCAICGLSSGAGKAKGCRWDLEAETLSIAEEA